MLIIWLQGIWLPLHGYDYADTPLWAGIFLLPLTLGFLVSGPLSGTLSDRFGSRGIATAGMALFGATFIGLLMLPIDFPYWAFALLIAANGIGTRHVLGAEHLGDHEQRARRAAGRRVGNACHVPELRHGVVDRGVLLADGRRACPHGCQMPCPAA